MAMVISHNIPALTTYNTVNRTNAALEKSIQKLSTGLRINSAADDAAGLAISEKMRSQINGMDRAVSNAQDGISMVQTAEGALNETHSILQRMRELSVQAANDTLTSQDRGYIQMEIDQLREEVTRIGNTTQFNKKKLLNGDAAVLWSSSDLSTKAIVNGGLRSIDQFGQKVVTEGNYKISIKANPGTGEVQKSDIFKIKHENVITDVKINPEKGIEGVSVNKVPAGSYSLTQQAAKAPLATLTGVYGMESIAKRSAYTATMSATGTAAPAAGDVITISDTNGNELFSYKMTATDLSATPAVNDIHSVINKNKERIIAAAKEAGYDLKMSVDATSSAAPSFEVWKVGTEAPGIKVSYSNSDITAAADNSTVSVVPVTIDNSTTPNQDLFTFTPGTDIESNASVLFEVKSVDTVNQTVTMRVSSNLLAKDGVNSKAVMEDVVVGVGAANQAKLDGAGLKGAVLFVKDAPAAQHLMALSEGSKFVYTVNAKSETGGNDMGIQLKTTQDASWPETWNKSPLRQESKQDNGTEQLTNYTLDATKAQNKDVHLRNYYLNEKTGEVTEGDIILKTNGNLSKDTAAKTLLAGFNAAYVGKVASSDVKLRDLDKFWTSEGVFMLDDPKTITLTQGDGKQANVTLYATDTLGDVGRKLNEAIATGLGQGQYVDDASKFVTFVNGPSANSETVKGTFLVRTAVPGESGKVTFSGDENIINAFSLNQLQDATESTYTVSVYDAHTNEVVSSGQKVTGNIMRGIVHPNVDVQFDALSGVSATWNDARKAFEYSSKETTTTLHLSDNTTVFQIGANEGEDMGIHIGDMRATALGLDSVNVTNREAASRSITILDNAIDKVSTQRAKLGAYQNRLEHTINNLNTASENITAAESRIRDTDMAKEMMNFTKLQIMLQAGTSMLAQANQLPQNVMALVR